jgi:hypothetical protein
MHSLLLVIIAFVLTSLTSCTHCDPFQFGSKFFIRSSVPSAPQVDLPPPLLSVHAEEITAIVQDYSVELRYLKRLHLEHAHTYYNEEGIHTIQLRYISQDILDLCQGRKLIIDVSEGLLDQLNSNSLLVPEFTNHAFYPFNLEIYIDFESYFNRYIDPFNLKWICMEDSKITYYTADVDDNDKKAWHSKRESYNTSRDIVLYQRLAEDKFKAMKEPDRAVFGNKRFYPEEYTPSKIID